ncbi:putative tetratricopeptide-like helical domain superfamily [Plasmopara halstedii]
MDACHVGNEGRGVSEDVVSAVKLFQDAALMDNKHAKFHLDMMYEYGRGVPRDFSTQPNYIDKAASMYQTLHISSDCSSFRIMALIKALNVREQFLKAVDLGGAQAMYALRQMHIHGQGCTIDV